MSLASVIKKIRNFHPFDRISDIYDKLEQAGIIHWSVQAAALGYYCILGLIPFLALGFTIAKGFGLEKALYLAIDKFFANFKGQEQLLRDLQAEAEKAISNFLVTIPTVFWFLWPWALFSGPASGF